MYAILLEKGVFELVVEGLNCVTLGHGIQNSIAAHPYFGTDRVRDEIMAQPIVNGRVHANLPSRDESGLVKSMFHVWMSLTIGILLAP